ncbi:hypothetical protein BC628DRAFT_1314151 [Trametes gibbosa]|nr:hypothetical protein BC628DRAFT_1314151 [Trametes gibbosa]
MTTRYNARCITLCAHRLDSAAWKTSGHSNIPPFTSRRVSTTSPSITGPPSKELPPSGPGTAPRKHKVELRPGPVKPPKSPSDPASVLLGTTAASEHAPSTLKSPSEASTHSASLPHTHTVIEVAKEDYQEASKHGILTPPPANASWAGKLFHQAKELFKFYWNGIKLINTHRLRVRDINARVKAGGAPLSRWEARFIANYKRDALKLIPFALIILIAEEAIPLVVIYTPFLLPSTCLLPSQKERIDNKRREKQRAVMETACAVFRDVHTRALAQPDAGLDVLLDRQALSPVLSLSTFGTSTLLLNRLKKHLLALAEDDALLARENTGARLSPNELRDALEERGMCVHLDCALTPAVVVRTDLVLCSVTEGLSVDVMYARLRWWLTHTGADDADPIRTRVLLVARNAIGQYDASTV